MNGSQHILIVDGEPAIRELVKDALEDVDDEPAIRELIKDALEDEGYQLSLAANAAEAHRQAKDKKLSLASLDARMPEEDGIGLSHSWARQKSVSLPALVMSGRGA